MAIVQRGPRKIIFPRRKAKIKVTAWVMEYGFIEVFGIFQFLLTKFDLNLRLSLCHAHSVSVNSKSTVTDMFACQESTHPRAYFREERDGKDINLSQILQALTIQIGFSISIVDIERLFVRDFLIENFLFVLLHALGFRSGTDFDFFPFKCHVGNRLSSGACFQLRFACNTGIIWAIFS